MLTDVFVLLDRLLLLTKTCLEYKVIEEFPTCLRGIVLFWHSTELTIKERTILAHVLVFLLYEILIGRFKERTMLGVF
jgi:hypothetical protein